MKFFMFNTAMNILQTILFVCRWFYMGGDEPDDNHQTVVMPLHTNIQTVQKKPCIWRLGKNDLKRQTALSPLQGSVV
jgi:hypothetical protein